MEILFILQQYVTEQQLFDANVYNAAASGGSPPYPQFAGELISPLIDCSTFDLVSLKFYTHNLRLNGNTTFSTSIDNGATWGDPTTIETENVFTANETNLVGTEIKRYLISEVANQDSVRIKFTFNGDFYFFILDDVQLIEPERNNLAVMENFYAIAPNMMTPASQVNDPFSFLADVANLGALPQPNTNLNVSIIDNTTTQEVFNADLSYGLMPADTIIENIPFAEYFTPDGSITQLIPELMKYLPIALILILLTTAELLILLSLILLLQKKPEPLLPSALLMQVGKAMVNLTAGHLEITIISLMAMTGMPVP